MASNAHTPASLVRQLRDELATAEAAHHAADQSRIYMPKTPEDRQTNRRADAATKSCADRIDQLRLTLLGTNPETIEDMLILLVEASALVELATDDGFSEEFRASAKLGLANALDGALGFMLNPADLDRYPFTPGKCEALSALDRYAARHATAEDPD